MDKASRLLLASLRTGKPRRFADTFCHAVILSYVFFRSRN
jgi:hypothetical protein